MEVFCMGADEYPKDKYILEVLFRTDVDGREWKITRVINGFVLQYNDDKDYMRGWFFIDPNIPGVPDRIKNHNMIFFNSSDLDNFMLVWDLIPVSSTNSMFDTVEALIISRLENGGLPRMSEQLTR